MLKTSTQNIENNLVTNLVRIFTAYGWTGEGAPENYQTKAAIIQYGLHNGDALGYMTHLSMLINARRKDHKWGLYTPVFVEGVQTLLKSYCTRNKLFEKKSNAQKVTISCPTPKANIFTTVSHAKEAVERLELYGKTNIRYSLIEEYGEERVLHDLRRVCPTAKLVVRYDEHQPDQLRDWLYDENLVKMTVMYPILPLVILSIE